MTSWLIFAEMPCFSVPASLDPEDVNKTDVQLTIQMVKDNDPNCTEINFNNIPVSTRSSITFTSQKQWIRKLVVDLSENPQVSIYRVLGGP